MRNGFKIRLSAALASVLLALTACHTESGRADQSEDPGKNSLEYRMEKPGEAESSGEDPIAGPEASSTPERPHTPEGAAEQPAQEKARRLLTSAELRDFEEYLNRSDNYGFLMSDYQTPEYIDLNEVFYSGAGLEQPSLTKEEKSAYLKSVGQPEFYTDRLCLSTEQINTFLSEKTGLTLDQIKTGLNWVYLAQYDRYYTEHGDTNRRGFLCKKGEIDGGTYRIWCLSDYYSQFNLESIVTLKKVPSGYQFLSNEIIWDELGSYKAGADSPTTESLHYLVTAYKRELETGGGGVYSSPEYVEDYSAPIFDSAARYYTLEEMQQISWNSKLTAVFRNEIYARHGYIFKNDFWNEFFKPYSWYSGVHPGDTFDTGVFNEYEKANLKLAMEMEQ